MMVNSRVVMMIMLMSSVYCFVCEGVGVDGDVVVMLVMIGVLGYVLKKLWVGVG